MYTSVGGLVDICNMWYTERFQMWLFKLIVNSKSLKGCLDMSYNANHYQNLIFNSKFMLCGIFINHIYAYAISLNKLPYISFNWIVPTALNSSNELKWSDRICRDLGFFLLFIKYRQNGFVIYCCKCLCNPHTNRPKL